MYNRLEEIEKFAVTKRKKDWKVINMTHSKTVKRTRNDIDMTIGPLPGKILLFSLPLIFSNILQLLFNAADIVVVGRFAGETSLAAVGSTGSLTNLLINIFIGMSIGTNVLTARAIGQKNQRAISDTVHTSILFSILCGIALAIIGFFIAKPALALMETPPDVIDKSVLYMRIYFLGMPMTMLYNFGYAIMRAQGDTRRPMYYLIIAGIVNVLLNLFFVIKLDMNVAGVAIATVVSHTISALLILRCLSRLDNDCKFEIKKLRIKKNTLIKMMTIGIPAGIQGAVFSISNMLIQSSINYFGSVAMAANTAANNIEGFVYTSTNAIYQTTLSFISQNLGAKKIDRIKRVFILCSITVIVLGMVLSGVMYLFGDKLLGIYSTSPEVVEYGMTRFAYVLLPYFLVGLMEVMVGGVRGLGASVAPTIISLLGACAFRIVWIYTVFVSHKKLEMLYISYPISWLLTALGQFILFLVLYKKAKKIYQ